MTHNMYSVHSRFCYGRLVQNWARAVDDKKENPGVYHKMFYFLFLGI
jgi:hypothetical protein